MFPGYCRYSNSRVLDKILGVGTLEKKLTINAHKFSASATKAIEKAGGKVEVIA